MYLFELNMSNMKSEALAQECSKKVILKNSAKLTTACRSIFYNEGAACIDKSNF